MSHFNSVHTKLVDGELLQQAITSCGHQARTKHYVRGYNSQVAAADIVAVLDGNYDLGFLHNGDHYQAVGDFSMGSCGGGDKSLAEKLNQIVAAYAAQEAIRAAEKAGLLENVSVIVH